MQAKLIGAAAALALVALLVVWALLERSGRHTAEANEATALAANAVAMKTIDTLREDYQRQAQALAWHQQRSNEIEAEKDAWEHRFKEAQNGDPAVQAWALEPVPDDVRKLFQ